MSHTNEPVLNDNLAPVRSMTLSEFDAERDTRPCGRCGRTEMMKELNVNNGGLLVRCPHCGWNRPWGHQLYLKQNERKRTRPPLPDGETLDSIWAKWDDRCFCCGGTKDALAVLEIGRQVHHVAPYFQEGNKGPLMPICTHCHALVNVQQRIFWFHYRRAVSSSPDSGSLDIR